METEPAKKHPKWKLALAGVGVAYLIGFTAWAGNQWWKRSHESRQPNMAAHPERAQEMLVDREVQRISEKLGLSDDQKTKVREILQKTGAVSAPPAQAMQGMMEARRQIREVLTPEQQEKMGREEGARVNQFADRMIERLKKEVGITEQQEKSIRAIMQDANPMRAAGDNGTPMLQRFQQTRDRIRNLLTPEQQEKFDKLPGPGGGMLRRLMPGGGRPQEEN